MKFIFEIINIIIILFIVIGISMVVLPVMMLILRSEFNSLNNIFNKQKIKLKISYKKS